MLVQFIDSDGNCCGERNFPSHLYLTLIVIQSNNKKKARIFQNMGRSKIIDNQMTYYFQEIMPEAVGVYIDANIMPDDALMPSRL